MGTGSYLTTTDPADLQQQSIYAIKDPLIDLSVDGAVQDTYTAPRTLVTSGNNPTPLFVPRFINTDTATITSGGINKGDAIRVVCGSTDCKSAGPAMNWESYDGWYIDLPESGERVNVDMNLTLGTLTVPSNIPVASECESGGHGWINYLNFNTGLPIQTPTSTQILGSSTGAGISGTKVSSALIVGLNMVLLQDSNHPLAAIVTTSDYQNQTVNPAYAQGSFQSKRDFWRDIEAYPTN